MVASIAMLVACLESANHKQNVGQLQAKPAPLSIEQLRDRKFDTSLSYERELDDGPSFTAYLVSYVYSGLKLHAMVAVPKSQQPEAGFPVVIANHGYVPDPTRYGITAEGIDSRPGDYYRSVPELYASRGLLVVMPDYRGHNSSQGLEFVDGKASVDYYAEDVVALMSALDDLEDADLANVFMWSHSMGGVVSMRVLLATNLVKAASYWSTMNLDELAPYFRDIDVPLMIQHSTADPSTSFSNSERLAESLRSIGQRYTFYRYESAEHYFESEARNKAAERDTAFFRSLMQ